MAYYPPCRCVRVSTTAMAAAMTNSTFTFAVIAIIVLATLIRISL